MAQRITAQWIGRRITAARQLRGWNPDELATRTGITRKRLERCEATGTLTCDELATLAATLCLPVDHFTGACLLCGLAAADVSALHFGSRAKPLTYFRNSRNIRKLREGVMIEVGATEFAKNFGRYKELAQRELVAITSHGRTSGYFISEHEYAEYQQLKASRRYAYHVSELPDATIRALETAQMPPAYAHLNALLDEEHTPDGNPA